MNLKKLFENAKKTKKDGAKISVPEFFVGEIILNDTLFETFQDGDSAFGSLSCTGQVDINLKKADVIVNGTTYKGLSVNVNEFNDSLVWSINFNDVNVWNIAPIAVMVLIDSEGYCTDYTMIATPEEGEYTISIKADGSGRVMKLHGASRTYSHTAEPRNVRSSEAVKDWPIKKETEILIDQTYNCLADTEYTLINEWSGDEEEFKQLKVEVNGEVIPYDEDTADYSVPDDFAIYYNPISICLYSNNGGTYQIKITEEQTIVAEDFKEAVEMIGGGGGSSDPYMPPLPDPTDPDAVIEYPILYAVGGHGEYSSYAWTTPVPSQINPNNVRILTMLVPIKSYGGELDWNYIDLTEAKGFNLDNAKFILQGTMHTTDIPTNLSLKYDNSPTLPPVYGSDADGTYVLKATKSGASITYAWVKE